MKKRPFDETSWEREFREFENAPPRRPPSGLKDHVRREILVAMSPSVWAVFGKLTMIHIVASAFTLLFCPQFGVSFLGAGAALESVLSHLGEVGCMAACGAIFLGCTGLAAGVMLLPEEIRVIRNTRFLQLAALSFISFGLLFSVAEQERVLPLAPAAAWLLGALGGGTMAFQLAARARRAWRERLAG